MIINAAAGKSWFEMKTPGKKTSLLGPSVCGQLRAHAEHASGETRKTKLEWEGDNGVIHEKPLDFRHHLITRFDRGHYGQFVMPAECSELDRDWLTWDGFQPPPFKKNPDV